MDAKKTVSELTLGPLEQERLFFAGCECQVWKLPASITGFRRLQGKASSPKCKPYASKPAGGVSKEGEKGLGPHLPLTLAFACTFNQRWFTSTVS